MLQIITMSTPTTDRIPPHHPQSDNDITATGSSDVSSRLEMKEDIPTEEANWAVDLLSQMNQLRNYGIHCDTIITSFRGTTFRAHSVILAAGSDKLHKALCRKTKHKYTLYLSADDSTVKSFLDFLYTGKISCDLLQFGSLKILAARFCVYRLVKAVKDVEVVKDAVEVEKESVQIYTRKRKTLSNKKHKRNLNHTQKYCDYIKPIKIHAVNVDPLDDQFLNSISGDEHSLPEELEITECDEKTPLTRDSTLLGVEKDKKTNWKKNMCDKSTSNIDYYRPVLENIYITRSGRASKSFYKKGANKRKNKAAENDVTFANNESPAEENICDESNNESNNERNRIMILESEPSLEVSAKHSKKSCSCKYCGLKWAGGKARLVEHENMHEVIKCYKCSYCEKITGAKIS